MPHVTGVLDLHEFHLWSLNTSTFLCTVHVVLQTESALDVNTTGTCSVQYIYICIFILMYIHI